MKKTALLLALAVFTIACTAPAFAQAPARTDAAPGHHKEKTLEETKKGDELKTKE